MVRQRATLRLRVQVCKLRLCSSTMSHYIPLSRAKQHVPPPYLLHTSGNNSSQMTPTITDSASYSSHPAHYQRLDISPPLDSTISPSTDAMAVDSGSAGPSTEGTKRISTHGPRGSRREEWRLSKGLPAHPQVKGTNRQGGIAAKRKAGRCHRRR